MPDQLAKKNILLVDWRGKLNAGLINLAIWLIGYFSLNRLIHFEHYYAIPLTPLDALPLLPWTIYIYSTCWYNSALGIFLLPSKRAAWRFLGAILCAYAINFAFFALIPTQIEALRESVVAVTPEMSPLWRWQFELTHKIDGPYTCFPSLHITNCVLVTLAHWRSRWRYWLLGWAILIAFSTLTTKQHVSLDILGGIFVGVAGTLIAGWLWGAPLKEEEPGGDQMPVVG